MRTGRGEIEDPDGEVANIDPHQHLGAMDPAGHFLFAELLSLVVFTAHRLYWCDPVAADILVAEPGDLCADIEEVPARSCIERYPIASLFRPPYADLVASVWCE